MEAIFFYRREYRGAGPLPQAAYYQRSRYTLPRIMYILENYRPRAAAFPQ